MNTQNSEKVIITSGIFIITFMMLDALLNGEYDKVPREVVGGLLLVFMLSTFQFVGLGRIAGPFAALIAGTVFLSRGGRIYEHLAQLAEVKTEANAPTVPSAYINAPEHNQGG